MQKWEYLTVIIRGNHALNPTVYTINGKYINIEKEFRMYLVELGVEGWELVGIREDAYYFKRPIE
jgi:hypothetical protein